MVFAVACDGGDDDDGETPTSVPTVEAPTEAPASPTTGATGPTGATGTAAPEPTDTPQSTQSPGGTPFPGSTDPVSFDQVGEPGEGNFVLDEVRVGGHDGFDRIVFEFEDDDGRPGGLIEYVDDAVQCGSGEPVEVEGSAILAVRFDRTQAHDDDGDLTIDSIRIDGPGDSILEAVSFCDFEGVVQWAIGVPGEQNFKVAFLEDPGRIVVDIKWP